MVQRYRAKRGHAEVSAVHLRVAGFDYKAWVTHPADGPQVSPIAKTEMPPMTAPEAGGTTITAATRVESLTCERNRPILIAPQLARWT